MARKCLECDGAIKPDQYICSLCYFQLPEWRKDDLREPDGRARYISTTWIVAKVRRATE